MNKFIGVSLTLLIVASLASAVVIESPAAPRSETADRLAREMTVRGFVSGAIVDVRTGGNVRTKTATFAASDAEIRAIAAILKSPEADIPDQRVVLGGVAYKADQKDFSGLVAENGGAGIVANQMLGGF